MAFIDTNDDRIKCSSTESTGNTSSLQRISSLERSSLFAYNELRLYFIEATKIKCLFYMKFPIANYYIFLSLFTLAIIIVAYCQYKFLNILNSANIIFY